LARRMTFGQHLYELRRGLLFSLVAFLVMQLGSLFFVKPVLHALIEPVHQVAFFSPGEALLTYFKLSLIMGMVLSLPVWLYQIWRFVSPGLRPGERTFTLILILPVSLSFAGGVAFAYLTLLPYSLNCLLSFGDESIRPMLSLEKYLDFVFNVLLAGGIIFLMPCFAYFLTRVGLVHHRMLARIRKFAWVAILLVAAWFMPPDLLSLIVVMVPMVLLYELSILVSFLARKGDTRAAGRT